MNEQHDRYGENLNDLLEELDSLFPELREEVEQEREPEQDDLDFDPDDYTPEEARIDEPILYQNYSNRYGAQVRNYSNGYGAGSSTIPVYNGDFRRVPEPEYPADEQDAPVRNGEPEPKKVPRKRTRRRKRRGCGCGCAGLLLLPVLALAVAAVLALQMLSAPDNGQAAAPRKPDTAAILLCGTDLEGERTDTMMLLYLSGSEKRVGLLSLPRDTYTITSRGNGAKLNSAYARNGMGEEGMEGLLDYVQEIIGYRPDGYMLVNMDVVPRIVDTMGGLEMEVPMSFELEGVYLEEGLQQLGGIEVLQLLRYRSGYAMQDLGRIEMQRAVISAAMEQWVRPDKIMNALDALALVQDNSITNLSGPNYFWVAKTILLSGGELSSHTLPGYADYIGDVSYYILNRQQVADLINEAYNPYTTEISAEDLKIAG